MLGSTPITAILGAAPPADAPTARLKSFAKAAGSAGLALILVAPGSKYPVDMRAPVTVRKEDAAAQDAAKEAGRTDWHKAKSLAGSHLATTDGSTLGKYLDRYRKTFGDDVEVNFAVEVGRSRLIVVDCDTAAQVDAFMVALEVDPPVPPTVRSPGMLSTDGTTWAHKDGGHFYFTVPEGVELPDGAGSITMPGEWVILWHDRYVLIPPSVRPEGPYQLAGREYEAPDVLLDVITEHAEKRAERRHALDNRETTELDEGIDAWAESVSWDDILAPAGWAITARTDKCGCPVWTAPGDHGSPKSATTHDTGCMLGRYTDVNAPMHIWTDNPGELFEEWISKTGSKTLSKLQAIAVTTYGGDVGTACAEIGILQGGVAIEAETGVDVKAMNSDTDTGTDVRNLDGEIELPETPPRDLVLTRDAEGNPVIEPDVDQPSIEEIDEGGKLPGIVHCEQCGKDFPRDRFVVENGVVIHDTATIDRHPRKLVEGESHPDDGASDEHRADAQAHERDLEPVDEGSPNDPVEHDDPLAFGTEGDAEKFPEHSEELDDPDDAVLNSQSNGVPKIAPFDYWRGMQPPEYAVEGMIENNALTCIIGRPGIGKSVVAIDIACSLVTGIRWQGRKTIRQRVLYLPGEGLAGAVERIIAWEQAHDLNVGQDLIVGNSIIQLAAAREDWAEVAGYILKHRVGLVIFDTFARMSLGLEENSASDVGKAITRFDQIKKLTGAGVLVVHHTGKVGTSARGSSALNGALDSELLITDPQWDTTNVEGEGLELTTSKQKNAARLRDAMPLVLTPMHGSVVLTGPTGVIGDPLDTVVAAPLLVPEPIVETAIRLKMFAVDYPEQGVTRGEFVAGVLPDEYTLARKNADMRWKRQVAEAVDLGLRYGLIETLTGRPTGSRYIVSSTTAEAARRRAADDAMGE